MKVDENRPSASEQAVKDDRNRQNVKGKDPALTSQSGQAAARNQSTKESKSAFDLVLENYTSSNLPTQSEAAKFDAKIKDALADDDKDRDRSDRKKDKKDDKKTSSSEEKETGRSSREVSTRDKVVGKQTMSQGGSGGSSSGSDDKGGGSGQFGGRSFKQTPLSRAEIAAQGVPGAGRTENVFSNRMVGPAQSSPTIPKAVLDQIVQHVRVGLNKNLDKEIQVDLSDKVFRGLSLKVSSNNGKIEVTFLTGNADVKRLFESQKGHINQALSEKGIAVSQIRVQYLG